MTVLITGGTGTVGSAVADALGMGGHRVVVMTDEPGLPADAPPGAAAVVTGDVRDRVAVAEVMREWRPRTVVHAAAITPGPERERDEPDSVIDVNVTGALRVLDAFAEQVGERGRFVSIGSIAAYGDAIEHEPVLIESADGRPRNVYEISKQAAEYAILRVARLRGVGAVSLRLGDVFGSSEHPTGRRDVMSAPWQLSSLARSGAEAVLPGVGLKRWIHTRDVGAAVRRVVESVATPSPVINVGTEFEWSLLDWCALLADRYRSFQYRVDPEQPNIDVYADNPPMDLGRLTALGFRPAVDLRTAFAIEHDVDQQGGAVPAAPTRPPHKEEFA